jgi:hypothetical protein
VNESFPILLRTVSVAAVSLATTFRCHARGSPSSRQGDDRIGGVSLTASTDTSNGDFVDRGTSDVIRASGAFCEAATAFEKILNLGVPPQRCMAPCVWDLIRSCLPRGKCGVDNGWSLVEDPFSDLRGFYGYKVFVQGRLCFGFSYGSVPRSHSLPQWSYTNEEGKVVARALGTRGAGFLAGSMVCSVVSGVVRPNGTYLGPCDGGAATSYDADAAPYPVGSPVCTSSSAVTYSVDPNRPECAAWRGMPLF